MNIDLLLCILGMALVTLIPRVMPVTLLAGRELPPLLTRWLSFVPVSVLAALVAPDLLLADVKLNITGDNLFVIATSPSPPCSSAGTKKAACSARLPSAWARWR